MMMDNTIFYIAIGLLIAILIIVIPLCIFYICGLWKLFKKAGKNGWEALIPYYNTYILCEISGLNTNWFIASIVSSLVATISANNSFAIVSPLFGLVNICVTVAIMYNLAKKFHKDDTWVVLAVLFNIIIIPLLGFSSKDKYDNNVVVDENSCFKGIFNK